MAHPTTLTGMAVDVLSTADGREKTAKSRAHAARWLAARETGNAMDLGTVTPRITRPDRTARNC